jgi:hypothetical protein
MPLSRSDDERAVVAAGPIHSMQRDDFCAD